MDKVTIKEAAELTGLSERTIRRRVKAGVYPHEEINARRYAIPRSVLPARRLTPTGDLLARVEALERAVQRLTYAVEALTSARTLPPVAQPSESHYSAPGSHSDAHAWSNYTDGARWLERHGVPMNTARQWTDWRGVIPLERSAMLRDAISRYDPTNWRITWRLHRCTVADCPCHELLPQTEP
jgi:excisionase family DNA binding protein